MGISDEIEVTTKVEIKETTTLPFQSEWQRAIMAKQSAKKCAPRSFPFGFIKPVSFVIFVVIVVVIDRAPYKRYLTNEFLISDDFFEKPTFWWTTRDDRRPRVPIESLNPVKLMFVLLLTNDKSHILFPGRGYRYFKRPLYRLPSQTHNQGKYTMGSHCQILVVLLLPAKSDQCKYSKTGPAVFRPYVRPGGVAQQNLKRGGPAPNSNLLPFYILFLTENVSLWYNFPWKMVPF